MSTEPEGGTPAEPGADPGADPGAGLAEAERRRCAAMVAGDADELARWVDPAGVYTHSSGMRESGAELVGRLRSGALRYRELETSADQVRALGQDTAVVAGRMRAVAVVDGTDRPLDLLTTLVWSRSAGGWRLVAFHGTAA